MKKYILISALAMLVGCTSNDLYNGSAITAPGRYIWDSGEPGPATCQALVQHFQIGDQVIVHATNSAGCAMQVYGASNNSPVLVVYPGNTESMTFDGQDFHSN